LKTNDPQASWKEKKRWLAFLFVLSAVWILAATPERKEVSHLPPRSPITA